MNTTTMPNELINLTISPRLAKNLRRNIKERLIEFILMLAALSAVFTTFAIVAILLYESFGFFKAISLVEFFTGKEWTPLFEDAHYGIMPLISGTLTTSAIALAVAVPVGTIGAIYLSEFASHKTREITKPILELLVGVPTIAFGYFALLFVTPMLQKIFPELPGFNMLSAGLVTDFEKELGCELNYTVITPTEYVYRKDIADRFLTTVMSAQKNVLIDRLDVMLKA